MPRLIDTNARRHEIAEATWRLVREQGLEAVSVRNVAREAGLSTGSLRHAFPTQADLLAFSFASLGERFLGRIEAVDAEGEPLDVVERILAELLPLDDERRREAEAWLAFIGHARVDAGLQGFAARADQALRGIVRTALDSVGLGDDEIAVETTYALVDGLTLHAVLRPGQPTAETMRRALRAHLEGLVKAP